MSDDKSRFGGVSIGNVLGDIRNSIIAGRDVVIEYTLVFQTVINNPSKWPDIVFEFLSSHRYYLIFVIVIQILLFALFWSSRGVYAIPWRVWGLLASLLQFGTWLTYTSMRFTGGRWRKGFASASIVGVAAIAGAQSWEITHPAVFPPQALGIAVVNLNDEATFNLSHRAGQLSDQIYDALCRNIRQAFEFSREEYQCSEAADGESPQGVVVRRFDVVLGDSVKSRDFGARTEAELVVWGWLESESSGDTTIRFEVLETLDAAINPDVPLVMPVTSQSAGIIVREQIASDDPDALEEITAQQAIVVSAFALGFVAYLNQEYPEAIRQFKIAERTLSENEETLQVRPESRSFLYYYLGKSYHHLDLVAPGQNWLLKAEIDNPREPAIPLSLALGYANLNQPEKRDSYLDSAMRQLQHRLDENPEDVNALYDRGLIFQIRKQHANAALVFQDLLQIDPAFYIGYLSRSAALYELGRFEEAIAVLRQAIDLSEDSGANASWAYVQLGSIYQQEGMLEEAREAYRQAVTISSQNDRILLFYARFLEGQGEWDAALDAYKGILEVSPRKGWANGELARYYHDRARMNMPAASISYYLDAINYDEGNSLLYMHLAEAYRDVGDKEQAAATCARAIQQNQEQTTEIYLVYAICGDISHWLENNERAVFLYNRSLELHPDDCSVLLNQGRVFQILSQNENAVDNYQTVLEIEEKCSSNHIDIARRRLSELN